jgi:ATP-binding cassette subfamily B protein
MELPHFFRELGIVHQAMEILALEPEVQDHPKAKALKVSNGEIIFDRVTFRYPGQAAIFENKSLTIRAGEKIGLVGFSGSGKSTFVHLMMRLYDLQGGRILVDGQDISLITQDSLRENIAFIPQETTLFHRSLMDNIRYGRLDASDAEVMEAARLAHCHEFIENLPEGYATECGERGIKLSGGQRQRIAIARALLKNAPILLLDEATSALDSATEKVIQDSLDHAMEGRTCVVIAHRLSTLHRMDRILVFHHGELIEEGTHRQLLKQQGHYAHLWALQSGGFLPEAED